MKEQRENAQPTERHPPSVKDGQSERKREKPLAIRGTLDDVLKAAMRVKPKDEQTPISGRRKSRHA